MTGLYLIQRIWSIHSTLSTLACSSWNYSYQSNPPYSLAFWNTAVLLNMRCLMTAVQQSAYNWHRAKNQMMNAEHFEFFKPFQASLFFFTIISLWIWSEQTAAELTQVIHSRKVYRDNENSTLSWLQPR